MSDPFFADVVLECGGGDLPCHAFMLAARSHVFRASLQESILRNRFSDENIPHVLSLRILSKTH
jgi:hypothetical protein